MSILCKMYEGVPETGGTCVSLRKSRPSSCPFATVCHEHNVIDTNL